MKKFKVSIYFCHVSVYKELGHRGAFVTSATEGGRRLCFYPSVFGGPFVSEQDISKNKSIDLDDIWWIGCVCGKDELIRFW